MGSLRPRPQNEGPETPPEYQQYAPVFARGMIAQPSSLAPGHSCHALAAEACASKTLGWDPARPPPPLARNGPHDCCRCCGRSPY